MYLIFLLAQIIHVGARFICISLYVQEGYLLLDLKGDLEVTLSTSFKDKKLYATVLGNVLTTSVLIVPII